MAALVAGETMLLVLLAVLVVGLLRSHAEILRRLGPAEDDGAPGPADLVRGGRSGAHGQRARDISGATPDGDAVQVGLSAGSPTTLVAFLSSGCSTCETFWRELAGLPGPLDELVTRTVIVTHDQARESPGRLRELAPAGRVTVMSSAAWADHGVEVSPYFLLVDGTVGEVIGEGTARSLSQLEQMLRDGAADSQPSAVGVQKAPVHRSLRAEQALAQAGIGPGHRSLYPASGARGGQDAMDPVR